MLRSALTVGVWTMASRVLGFARDMLIAATLGAGPVADAFFVALKLPNLFRRLFGEGAFNAAFIPAFAGILAVQGHGAARVLAARMAGLMTLGLSALVVLGIAFMPQAMRILAPGFVDEPAKFALAVELTRITFPYLLLICLTALVSGVLNGLDRFAAAAAAPVFFNLLAMASLLVLTPYLATPGHALAWGVTAAGAVQLGLVLWAAARAGMAVNPLGLPRLAPGVRAVLRRMLPGLLGAGVTQLNLAIDVIIASLLPPGAVSFLYYADRVAQLPLGVIGAAVGTALLPLLSRQVRTGLPLQAHRTINRAIEMSLLLTLPCAAGLGTAAMPVVAALLQRGAFDPAATQATAAALGAYALGLPAFVLVKVFAPGFFARGDTAAPVRIGLAAVALNLTLNLAFIYGAGLAHAGVALATSLAAWFNALALAAVLARRGQLALDRRARRRLPRLVAATAAMAAMVLALNASLPPVDGAVANGAALAALVAAGALAYAAVAQALGALDLRELRAMLRRRGGRPTTGPPEPTGDALAPEAPGRA